MIALVKKASLAALVCLATAAQATEGELWFRKAEKVALARGIQKNGFTCSEIKAVYFVAAEADGNHMRAICGLDADSAASSSFRLTVRGSGTFRVEPWEDSGRSTGHAQFASGFMLRTSLN